MPRCIYDEVKQKLNEVGIRVGSKEDEADYKPMLIVKIMAIIAHEQFNCTAPGEIPDEKIDEYIDKVYTQCCKTVIKMRYIECHKYLGMWGFTKWVWH